ncbi:MAG: M20/M25/M40 family metallo-hydrolase [Gammaproteobacteria bacterium]|nr:M20/M25/M40 family metallo-hydrolase [Gammaproteobacteria bacterium]
MRTLPLLAGALLALARFGAGQTADPSYLEEANRLAAEPRVAGAFRLLEELDGWALERTIELTEIPAPPFMEEVRGRRYAELLAEAGADSVWTDAEGNVIALRRGRGGERTVALNGHLDTVFPPETDVTVTQVGDTLFAPGVGDDTRGLVVVLAVLRAMEAEGIETEDDIHFIGTVGEEGLGDLRGVKHIYRAGADGPDEWISVDGGGLDRIVSMGLGSVRYRVTFEGTGGHSWGAFGIVNPAHALGRAIRNFQAAADRLTRDGPPTSYNVGRLGGGASVNAVPSEAWMEVDMRSESPANLEEIEGLFLSAVDTALREENGLRRQGPALAVRTERIGFRPSGETDPSTPLVQRAIATAAFFGGEGELARSSTDANTPISLGVPAVTIGRGGIGANAHGPGEYWVNVDGHIAMQRALLLVLATAGLADPLP